MDKVATLICGHSFDQGCIAQWLKTPGKKCPLYRGEGKIHPFILADTNIAKMTKLHDRTKKLQQACDVRRATEPPRAPIPAVEYQSEYDKRCL